MPETAYIAILKFSMSIVQFMYRGQVLKNAANRLSEPYCVDICRREMCKPPAAALAGRRCDLQCKKRKACSASSLCSCRPRQAHPVQVNRLCYRRNVCDVGCGESDVRGPLVVHQGGPQLVEPEATADELPQNIALLAAHNRKRLGTAHGDALGRAPHVAWRQVGHGCW